MTHPVYAIFAGNNHLIKSVTLLIAGYDILTDKMECSAEQRQILESQQIVTLDAAIKIYEIQEETIKAGLEIGLFAKGDLERFDETKVATLKLLREALDRVRAS